MCKLEAIRLFSRHQKYRAVFADNWYFNDQRSGYRVDILLINNLTREHDHSLEVEHKLPWEAKFPYKDLQFLPRKKEKWDDPAFTYGRPTHFMMFNRDINRHLVVFDHTIRSVSEQRLVDCKGRGMEWLYCIPLDQVYFDYL